MDIGNKLNVCRLCLRVINDNNFETLDAVKLGMVKMLPLDLSPSYTTNGSICSQCSDKLQRIFNFKTTCLNNNDYLKTFLHHDSNFTLVLEEVIVREVSDQDKIKHEEEKVCRFCLKYFEIELFTKLNEVEEDIFLKDVLEKCLPEIDINITKVPLMCPKCLDMLQNQFNFVISCLEVEERIKEFKSSVGADDNNLSDVIKCDASHEDFNSIKLEAESDNDVEYVSELPVKEEVFEDTEESEFKCKTEECLELCEETEESEIQCKTEECLELYEESIPEGFIKIEENIKSNLEEDVSDSTSVSEHPSFPKLKVEQKNNRPKLLQKDGMFVCNFCPHQTNLKPSMQIHLIKHKNDVETSQFKCKECDFVTKWKASLPAHALLHKNPVEVEMFYCASCPYKSIYKKHVRRHCKTHMKSSTRNTSMYHCQYCSFTTKDKTYFKYHNKIKHTKNVVLIEEYMKCDQCDYVSKNDRNLNNHLRIVHKREVEGCRPVTHACESCDFKTRRLCHFQSHLLKHKSCSAVEMFSCSQCSFQTKYKNSLQIHLKRHETGWKPKRQPKNMLE